MSSKGQPIISVGFVLGGAAFAPEDVTARLGFRPTHQYRAGDSIAGGKGRRRSDRWIVRVGPRASMDASELVEELRARLTVDGAVVRRTCAELGLEAWIHCQVEPAGTTAPTIGFSTDVVGWAQNLGAAIHVDVMLWEADD